MEHASSQNTTAFFHVDESVWLGRESGLSVLKDLDGDGKADIMRNLLPVQASASKDSMPNVKGLTKGPDGWLYFSMSDRNMENEPMIEIIPSNDSMAIFKCQPDGTYLEKLATGFRYPSHLVFDTLGNLFTCDQGDNLESHARWIYVIEGADYGYRSQNQDLDRSHWSLSEEEAFQEQIPFSAQPAYIFPSIGNIAGVPSGWVHYPGTGLPGGYEHRFFFSYHSGASKGIWTLTQKPTGAFFELKKLHDWIPKISPTSLTLDHDGGLYVAHSGNSNGLSLDDGIYRIRAPELRHAPLVQQTSSILKSDLSNKTTTALIRLLRHPDQRVRIKAQTSLVKRGASTLTSLIHLSRDPQHLMPRLHAIWAIEQLAKSDPQIANRSFIQSWLADLLNDPSPEVRAQIAILTGRIGNSSMHANIIHSLNDPSDRVRQMAAISVGRLKPRRAWEPILEWIAHPRNHHPVLRHAGVMALAGAFKETPLSNLKTQPSEAVRLSSTLALRRKGSAKIAGFLLDESPIVAVEAARAIDDFRIPDAQSKLAGLHATRADWMFQLQANKSKRGATRLVDMLMCVYHTHFLQGQAMHLKALLEASNDASLPDPIRAACLEWIRKWNFHGDQDAMEMMLKNVAEDWLKGVNPDQQQMMLGFAETFDWQEYTPSVLSLFRRYNALPELRSAALKLLFQWKLPDFPSLIDEALISNSAFLRKEGVLIQAKINPDDMVAKWTQQLEFGNLNEKQEALEQMGNMPDRRVDAVFLYWLEQALKGNIPQKLKNSIHKEARHRTAPAVVKALDQWQALEATSLKQPHTP